MTTCNNYINGAFDSTPNGKEYLNLSKCASHNKL